MTSAIEGVGRMTREHSTDRDQVCASRPLSIDRLIQIDARLEASIDAALPRDPNHVLRKVKSIDASFGEGRTNESSAVSSINNHGGLRGWVEVESSLAPEGTQYVDGRSRHRVFVRADIPVVIDGPVGVVLANRDDIATKTEGGFDRRIDVFEFIHRCNLVRHR